ncbi:hypothetical protein Pmani_016073 [Petrolisthes manimaculis]|uniref:Uncharacterized protein n=1 Tax=Petrolisthes manimaculis TaxID=1843537 RepID=A0AAE1PPR3_9EUCA|nr:hypothetical protein Pmani_016073 [Petrolisthes manimaculis]
MRKCEPGPRGWSGRRASQPPSRHLAPRETARKSSLQYHVSLFSPPPPPSPPYLSPSLPISTQTSPSSILPPVPPLYFSSSLPAQPKLPPSPLPLWFSSSPSPASSLSFSLLSLPALLPASLPTYIPTSSPSTTSQLPNSLCLSSLAPYCLPVPVPHLLLPSFLSHSPSYLHLSATFPPSLQLGPATPPPTPSPPPPLQCNIATRWQAAATPRAAPWLTHLSRAAPPPCRAGYSRGSHGAQTHKQTPPGMRKSDS